MTVTSGIQAVELVRAVAAAGLPGSGLHLPAEPLTEVDWHYLLHRCEYERLEGVLAAAVESGALPTVADQRAGARRLHRAALETCLLLEADLLAVADVLDAAAVEHRVLKGTAVGHLDYPDPSMRCFGDVDLLVRAEQYDQAVATLADAGYVRRFRELRPGFDRRFGKGVSFTNPALRETDLHRTLVMGPYGLWLDTEQMWASASTFELGGRRFAALDAELRFVHACYHAALGTVIPRVVPVRDVAQMASRTSDPVDLDRVRRIVASWRGEAVLARAVVLAWDAFALAETDLSRWARAAAPTRQHELALRTYLDPHLGYAARCFAGLRAVSGLRDKVAFGWALAFPSRSYGTGRHRGRAQRLRSGLGQLRRMHRAATPPPPPAGRPR